MSFRKPLSVYKLLKRKLRLMRHLSTMQQSHLNSNITIRYPMEQSSKQNSKDIAILFGWTGAKFEDLRKYSALFEMHGYSTVLVQSSPFQSIFLPEKYAKMQVNNLLTLIQPWLPLQNRNPVFLFVFSYTGCMLYISIARALQDRKGPHYNLMNLKGTVFDSGPVFGALTRASGVARGISLLISHALLRQVIKTGWYIFSPLIVWFEPLMRGYMKEIYDEHWRCPQLFLYSKADPLGIVKDIRDLCLYRQDLTVTVRQKCFEGSPHCGNLEYHPVDYQHQIIEFLKLCNVADVV